MVHGEMQYRLGIRGFATFNGRMPRPKAHFSVVVSDHTTQRRVKVELVDLPFSDGKRFRLRVNGRWAEKVPVGSKTIVLQQVRSWLVRQ